MAKKRITVDSDHLTLVLKKNVFGKYRKNILIISNYGLGIEEIVFTSQRYKTVDIAKDRIKEVAVQLGLKYVIED